MMSENEKTSIIPLSEAEIGKRYQVVSVNAKGAVLQRMLDMGLVPGVRLWVIRFAPLGDPIEIRIRHFLMSLRKEEAQDVEVMDIGYQHRHHSYKNPERPRFGKQRKFRWRNED